MVIGAGEAERGEGEEGEEGGMMGEEEEEEEVGEGKRGRKGEEGYTIINFCHKQTSWHSNDCIHFQASHNLVTYSVAWLTVSHIPNSVRKDKPHLILQGQLLHLLLRVANTNKSTWSEDLTFALSLSLFQFFPLVLPAGTNQVDGWGRAEEPVREGSILRLYSPSDGVLEANLLLRPHALATHAC